MYFGFERMWVLTFLPLGFIAVLVSSLALTGVFFVGAFGGGAAAVRYHRLVSGLALAAMAGVVVLGVVTGQLSRFIDWYGIAPLAEMVILAGMCLGSCWLMAMSYTAGKRAEGLAADDETCTVRTCGEDGATDA